MIGISLPCNGDILMLHTDTNLGITIQLSICFGDMCEGLCFGAELKAAVLFLPTLGKETQQGKVPD